MTNSDKASQMNLVFGPFVRYYFKQSSKSRFYAQLAGYFTTLLFYNYSSHTYDGTSGALIGTSKADNAKSNRTGIIPSIGWNYFFDSHTALHLNLGYNHYSNKNSNTVTSTPVIGQPSSSTSAYTLKSSELAWNIGFTVLLPSKK